MTTTIGMLKEKLAHVQQELAEVSAALNEIEASPTADLKSAIAPSSNEDPLAEMKFTDPLTLLPLLDAALTKMGIDVTAPALTPEELQELMLREGIRPEDNILSRGIIEAREEE